MQDDFNTPVCGGGGRIPTKTGSGQWSASLRCVHAPRAHPQVCSLCVYAGVCASPGYVGHVCVCVPESELTHRAYVHCNVSRAGGHLTTHPYVRWVSGVRVHGPRSPSTRFQSSIYIFDVSGHYSRPTAALRHQTTATTQLQPFKLWWGHM